MRYIAVTVLLTANPSLATTYDLLAAQNQAVEASLEIQSMTKEVNASSQSAKQHQSAYFPKVEAKAGVVERTNRDIDRTWFATLGLRFNLYNGGLDREAIKIAKLDSSIASSKRALQVNTLKFRVAEVYYDHVFQKKIQKLLTEALQRNESHQKLVAKSKAAGQVSVTDVSEFELRESILRSDLLEAKALEDFHMGTYLQLANVKEPVVFSEDTPHVHLLEQSKSLVQQAMRASPRVEKAQLRSNRAKSEIEVVRSQWLPKLDAEAEAGLLELEEDVEDPNRPGLEVRLVATWEIFSGGATLSGQRAKAEAHLAAQLVETNTRYSIEKDIASIFRKLEAIDKLHHLAAARQKSSYSYYQSVKSEYLRGYRNSADLAGASESLLEAKRNALTLETRYFKTLAKLEHVVGKPLKTSKVWEK